MKSSRPLPPDSPLPLLHFRTDGLADAEAFGQWRQLMAPLFHIEQARYTSAVPRGNLSVFLVGEIMVNRCTFNAQHLSRDPAMIAATPNHLVLQYYRSGGFRGAIAGRPVCIVRGQVTVADLSQEIDAYAATSDTIGLSVPRALLDGLDPSALTVQLDASRNRILGGYMATLPKRLGSMSEHDIPAMTAEIIAVLARVFGLEPIDNDLDLAVTDHNLLQRVLGVIEANIGRPDLSPILLSEQIGLSRATLYRLFAPMGGIMRYVQERRLLAVRDVLNDPLDKRTLAQLASAYGFASPTVLSRGFRAHFAMSPRDWRQKQAGLDLAKRELSPDPMHRLWRDLGRSVVEP